MTDFTNEEPNILDCILLVHQQGWDLTAKISDRGLRLIAYYDRGLTG